MTAPDFAAILAPWQTFTASDGAAGIRIREASELLAARVPELCQTCNGCGVDLDFCQDCGDEYEEPCSRHADNPDSPCPDCPTVGRLLAISAAVVTGDIGKEPRAHAGYSGGMLQDWYDGAEWMLAQLRAIR